jgi:murein DD-endopeptidase MepM/ murein hydrolase activator NlpD
MIYLRPVDVQFPISQHHGENPEDYPITNGHNGIDIALPEGNIVRAAADGVVERADLDTASAMDPKKGYGWHVRIIHPDDSRTIYGHLLSEEAIRVATGDSVRMGDPIGKSGGKSNITGFSSGPHLHFEIRLTPAVTSGINPEPVMVNEIPPEAGLFTMTVILVGERLNVRSGPSKQFGIVRKMEPEEQAVVFSLTGKDIWLRTQDGFVLYDPAFSKLD